MMKHVSRSSWLRAAAAAIVFLSVQVLPAAVESLPPGFRDTVIFEGLYYPMSVRFAPDGRVFVSEKSGLIKVFDGLTDPTPTIFADLRTNVHDYWDRGLMGLALDPNFPAQPYVYVSYAYDYDPATPNLPAPRWGDTCPTPPGPDADGCVISGRVSRLWINPDDSQNGPEQVLLENNWCQQFPSHSLGGLDFGPEGALYVTAGEGASFNLVDYGQTGGTQGAPPPIRKNPCGDPPSGAGGTQTAPSAEGGALRSQDLLSAGDPVAWNGSVLRVNPATGAAWPSNPNVGGNLEDDRTVAFGLRNPFRWTFRPGTSEMWIGDVGMDRWEEIDRLADPVGSPTENFGWPCYEGTPRQFSYDNTDLTLCENLYAQGPSAVIAPYFSYVHLQRIDPSESCLTAGSSVSGLAFYSGGGYPAEYKDALFFADHSRNCMWVLTKGANGLPDPASVRIFQQGTAQPVELVRGPGGDLVYVDHEGGTIHRIRYSLGNATPTARATASPQSGGIPLTVQFDGSGSSDADPGTTLTYAWDLDGDGQFDDSAAVNPVRTYSTAGQITVRLLVTDNPGASSIDSVVVSPGNHAPVASVTAPSSSLKWAVGDSIAYSGVVEDDEDGTLPPSAMHWDVVMHHCPSGTFDCHEHVVETIAGAAGGTFVAPDHPYYSHIEFRLSATDLGGLTGQGASDVDPRTVTGTFSSAPPGATIVVGFHASVAPFNETLIVNSTNSISAAALETLGGTPSYWSAWSDGSPRVHDRIAGPSPWSLTATYAPCATYETCGDGADNDCNGTADDAVRPGPLLSLRVEHDRLHWTGLVGAASYDVVRGSLNALLSSGGDFTVSTEACLRSSFAGTSFGYLAYPTVPGTGEWYLVRANNCAGAGTWNDGSAGDRDSGIAASGHGCPPMVSGPREERSGGRSLKRRLGR
jgi:glucose/arabinose dehydrogenase